MRGDIKNGRNWNIHIYWENGFCNETQGEAFKTSLKYFSFHWQIFRWFLPMKRFKIFLDAQVVRIQWATGR